MFVFQGTGNHIVHNLGVLIFRAVENLHRDGSDRPRRWVANYVSTDYGAQSTISQIGTYKIDPSSQWDFR